MNLNIKHIPAFQKALSVIKRIESHGFQAFFVGGSVRDALIGREIGDVDLASSATPVEIMNIFDKVIPVGMEHGTVIVRYDGESYEITTFRSESEYQDYRHPDKVEFVTDIKKDLARRDFTINAIALDKNGDLIDPFHGQQAIQGKKIQAVGNPYERFEEDPLRIMRAVRFVSQLGYSIEEETRAAVQKQGPLLEKIAVERIAIEFEKMFQGNQLVQAIEICEDASLFQYFPIFRHYPDLSNDAKRIPYPFADFAEIISFFVHCSPELSVDDWTRQWKLSKQVKNDARAIHNAIQYYQDNGLDDWLVYQLPEKLTKPFSRVTGVLYSRDSAKLCEDVKMKREKLAAHNRSELAFQAKDLFDIFPNKPRGPWIGKLLGTIEEKVVSRELKNDYNEIKEWVIKWNPPGRD
ncbi:tRNA nucleotidyltransferase (CCA-adding enzyme) [Thalassobacillus cyri]|uniref:CCA-adding enzyme n=1 Tax=Thalassobacillus cyri TaxID=571932 RepID=A0A1H4CPH6_9BACI|nr:CCA tRNA nucleotidyltransferase [Thalassobacillus cyri]SEA62311.1 tRNA nucleotidyltransferase (CCA-adding enzyme) [Thalassobacillus cyri]